MSNVDDPTDVAQKLRSLQSHFGLTLQEMANRCSLPKRSLENYMRSKNPQRPGLDALKSLADGMNVSIDWLLDRTDERFAPDFSTEDYALFCHSVVLRLLGETIKVASTNPEAFDEKAMSINGVGYDDIALSAMLDFMHLVRVQSGNPNRPQGYASNKFQSMAGSAIRRGLPQHIHEALQRKP